MSARGRACSTEITQEKAPFSHGSWLSSCVGSYEAELPHEVLDGFGAQARRHGKDSVQVLGPHHGAQSLGVGLLLTRIKKNQQESTLEQARTDTNPEPRCALGVGLRGSR